MLVAVKGLLGLDCVPSHRTSASEYLKRNNVPISRLPGRGGEFEAVPLLELPPPVQLAYRLRQAEEAGLTFGEQDDAAHVELQTKPVGVQQTAQARAAMLTFVRRHQSAGLSWQQIAAQFKGAGFGDGPSQKTIKRWFEMVADVDPANWAPALAPDYIGRTATAPLSEEAWAYFENEIEASGRNGTGANFHAMWKATDTQAAKKGWQWPPYRTVLRRWKTMDVARQRAKEHGAEAAARSLTLFLNRPVDQMFAMEQAEQDFREFKVLCIWEDGSVLCPRVGLAVDRASSKIIARTISMTENEEAVVALNADMVNTHGIPNRVVIDNGAAFNGFRMMGGKTPLIRRRDTGERKPSWAVPGVYKFLGINVNNHGPEMAWAKKLLKASTRLFVIWIMTRCSFVRSVPGRTMRRTRTLSPCRLPCFAPSWTRRLPKSTPIPQVARRDC